VTAAVAESGILLAADGGQGRAFRRYERRALGTWNVLLLADLDPDRPSRTDGAAEAGWALLDRLEDELSRFRPESDVCLLNALGAAQGVPIGRALFDVLSMAKDAWTRTDGAFDPTVGPLMDAWGFPRGPARVPPAQEIAALLERRGMGGVILDERTRTARFDRPGVALDLGAIGKGYAADRVAARLREKGVGAGAVLSGRSTIVVWGPAPGGGPWRVDLLHPGDPSAALRTLLVESGSVSTSAGTEERFILDGVEYGHILDPRTGLPVQSRVRSVTVWTETAVRGDILSTALFVLGKGAAPALVAAEGRASALIVEEDPSAWGGLQVDVVEAGDPALRVLKEPPTEGNIASNEPKEPGERHG